eukprot:gene22556-29681_t
MSSETSLLDCPINIVAQIARILHGNPTAVAALRQSCSHAKSGANYAISTLSFDRDGLHHCAEERNEYLRLQAPSRDVPASAQHDSPFPTNASPHPRPASSPDWQDWAPFVQTVRLRPIIDLDDCCAQGLVHAASRCCRLTELVLDSMFLNGPEVLPKLLRQVSIVASCLRRIELGTADVQHDFDPAIGQALGSHFPALEELSLSQFVFGLKEKEERGMADSAEGVVVKQNMADSLMPVAARLKRFDISGCVNSGEGFSNVVKAFKQLEHLSYSSMRYLLALPSEFSELGNCHATLRSLELRQLLPYLTALVSLSLADHKLDEAMLRTLSDCMPSLATLAVQWVDLPNEPEMFCFQMPSLVHLRLTYIYRSLWQNLLPLYAFAPNLKELYLGIVEDGDVDWCHSLCSQTFAAPPTPLPGIASQRAEQPTSSESVITSATTAGLAARQGIDSLHQQGGMAIACPAVTKLNIPFHGRYVTTSTMQTILRAWGSQLRELSISDLKLTAADCSYLLGSLPSLRRLMAGSWIDLDECGVRALAYHSRNLESVHFTTCPGITASAVEHLVAHGSACLETIDVCGCDEVQKEDMDRIQRSHRRPWLDLNYFD